MEASCAELREEAHKVLAGLGAAGDIIDDVLTVVTELVSNARRHAGGVTGFRVTGADSGSGGGSAVSIAVSDASPEPPRPQPWAPQAPGGFGWLLVNRLADSTRVEVRPDGKTITATFALDGSAPEAAPEAAPPA
ncbi:ATP-binding protein [Streptomyces sp. NPDC047014]|uniref:ATP-binding protein n=1 Tax=Streptomyces sp. NPDC047014 TaxID=3155736 RepID=UPI0033DBCC0A